MAAQVFTTYINKGLSWRDEQVFKVYLGNELIKSCKDEFEALTVCQKLNKELFKILDSK